MRKIKLMALLLATLMIVSAFAGCAGVKKEELDALDVRVQALEDLLNGQQKDLAEIKDSVNAGKDNSDVLEAIESIKKDLEDKIKDVDGRVDEVGKADGAVGTVSDETKAAQQKALALIEVRRAEFNKVADEYAAADYTKISEALGTATGAVNAATTTTAVDAAMAALNAELGKYMTYAMKAYDYYTQLLGGVNADAADLVAEARAFLKEVKAVYDEKVDFVGIIDEDPAVATPTPKDGHIVELLYLVEDKDNDAKDVYIDIYGAINDLCNLFDKTTYTWNASNVTKIYIENAKGKLDWVNVYPLAAYTRRAKDLVTDIDEVVGGEIEFKLTGGKPDFKEIEDVYKAYSEYAEAALALGGETLAALVTNADKIESAQAQVKNLEDAFEAFKKATKLGIGSNADVFYYYDVIDKLNYENKLEVALISTSAVTAAGLPALSKDQKDVWIADEYAKVDDLLDEWKTTYNLSDENVLDIIEAYKGAGYYTATSVRGTSTTTYVYNKLVNELTVAAYNTFKSDVAPKIIAANAMGESVQLVLAIDDVKDSIEDLLKLQKKDKNADYPANIDINMTDVANLKIMVRDADIFADYVDDVEERVDEAFMNKSGASPVAATLSSLANSSYIDFYSFEADINELENLATKTVAGTSQTINNTYFGGVASDNRKYGDVYLFFVNEYTALKKAADSINTQIETLVEKVENNGLADNLEFVTLAGDYVALNANGGVTLGVQYDSNGDGTLDTDVSLRGYKAANGTTYAQGTANADKYVAVTKLYPKQDEIDAYVAKLIAGATATPATAKWTIFAFLYEHPEFEELLDLDDFNAAKKTMDERMVELFAKAEQFTEEVDAIEYVRIDATNAANTVIYEDTNKNGKYDAGEALPTAQQAVPFTVSLDDKDDVNAAFHTYTDWSKKGGALNQKMFANYEDSNKLEVADVYYMKDLGDLKIVVANATDMIHKLRTEINLIDSYANNFIKIVNNVKAVDSVNAFVVNFTSNASNLDGDTTKRDRFAWTSFTKNTHENADTQNGVYGIVKTNGYETGSLNLNYSATYKDNTAVVAGLKNGNASDGQCITKVDLLKAAVTNYANFRAAHVEYIADADNNYDTIATTPVYYQRTEYVPYATFDDKAAEYEKYDVLSVKGAIFALTKTASDAGNQFVREFRAMVNSSTTVAEIEDIIVTYNSIAGFTAAVSGLGNSALDAFACYEFDRLIDLGI